MNYREATLQKLKNVGTAGTWVFDINVVDVISRIDLFAESVKSKNDMDNVPAADLVKIEIVDGSDLLYSLSGKESQGVVYYDRKKSISNKNWAQAGGTLTSHYGIDFGRYLWDPVLGFDPTRFKNPQMRIQHNYRVSDDAATSLSIEVHAHLFDQKVPAPIGFLLNKSIYNYQCGAAGSFEYIDIPTDRILRKLFVRPYRTAYCPYTQVDAMRLSEDNDKRVPFDVATIIHMEKEKAFYPPIDEWMHTTFDVGTTYRYVQPTSLFTLIAGGVDGINTGYKSGHSRGSRFGWVQAAVGIENDLRILGYQPHHMVCFPFGQQQLIEDWYDVTKLGSLQLRLRAGGGGTSGYCDVITQQLRKY